MDKKINADKYDRFLLRKGKNSSKKIYIKKNINILDVLSKLYPGHIFAIFLDKYYCVYYGWFEICEYELFYIYD
jgi:hypothetical protein